MPEGRTKNGQSAADGGNSDPSLEIGTRLAAIRGDQGVRVSALARQIGVSPSLISQIERGQSRPSVSTLFALSEALEVPVDAFFRDTAEAAPAAPSAALLAEMPMPDDQQRPDMPATERRYMVRSNERAALDIDGGVRWERLTPTTLRAVDFLELIYSPGAESNASLYRHPGTEMVLVLAGELHIFVGFELYELRTGDSICFPSTLPHRYLNPTEAETRAVTVILLDGTVPGQPQTDGQPRRP